MPLPLDCKDGIYLHNGACETVLCVLEHEPHRTAGQKLPVDILKSREAREAVAAFVESIDAKTRPFPSGN
jgi:hypothetical protein